MQNESSFNNMMVREGLRVNTGISNDYKQTSDKLSCPWINQAISIAYKVSSESKDPQRHNIQREVVTLINKFESKEATKVVMAYLEGNIQSFINLTYEISRNLNSKIKAGRLSEDNKGTAPVI